jgi:hypothetical protein
VTDKRDRLSILEFDGVLTSTRRDRDGDVLETKGAEVDPLMPLLWQHIPMQPVGKFMGLLHRSDELLPCHFGICDVPLGRDAAVLVEYGALRLSHGFTPVEFEPIKDKDSPGWRVKRFKIREASLVSIPSNEDAEITAFSRGKLFHPLIKGHAELLFKGRSRSVVSGFEHKRECGGTCAKCKSAGNDSDGAPGVCKMPGCNQRALFCDEHVKSDDSMSGGVQVTPAPFSNNSPLCASPGCNRKATVCGDHAKKGMTMTTTDKSGRVLSAENQETIQSAHDLTHKAHEHSASPAPVKSMCRQAKGHMLAVLDSARDMNGNTVGGDAGTDKSGRAISTENAGKLQQAMRLTKAASEFPGLHQEPAGYLGDATGLLTGLVGDDDDDDFTPPLEGQPSEANPGVSHLPNPGVHPWHGTESGYDGDARSFRGVQEFETRWHEASHATIAVLLGHEVAEARVSGDGSGYVKGVCTTDATEQAVLGLSGLAGARAFCGLGDVKTASDTDMAMLQGMSSDQADAAVGALAEVFADEPVIRLACQKLSQRFQEKGGSLSGGEVYNLVQYIAHQSGESFDAVAERVRNRCLAAVR